MRTLQVAIVSFISSALLFVLASLTNFTVETVQSNGLPEIYEPYGWISFVSEMAAIWFVVLGVALLLVALWRRAIVGSSILGAGLISSGVFAVLFALFWSLVNLQDEGPRCLTGCAPSLLQYYQTVYVASAVLVVLGIAAAVYGAQVLIRGRLHSPNDTSSKLTS